MEDQRKSIWIMLPGLDKRIGQMNSGMSNSGFDPGLRHAENIVDSGVYVRQLSTSLQNNTR